LLEGVPIPLVRLLDSQWHSWGLFTHEDLVTESNMLEMAEALVSSGMADAGYDTVNVVCNGTSTSCARKERLYGNSTTHRRLWQGLARSKGAQQRCRTL
jgi:hypothetical protein